MGQRLQGFVIGTIAGATLLAVTQLVAPPPATAKSATQLVELGKAYRLVFGNSVQFVPTSVIDDCWLKGTYKKRELDDLDGLLNLCATQTLVPE